MRVFFQHRKALIIILQALLVVATYYMAFSLRLDFSINPQSRLAFFHSLPWVLAIKLIVFAAFGLLRGWWRYVGMNDLLDITKASVTSGALLYAAFWAGLWPRLGYPRSVILIDLLLTILCIGGARVAARFYAEALHNCVAKKETLIVGAGVAGSTILRELKQNPSLDYKPIGFVDDDRSKLGIKIHGKPVLGATRDIGPLVAAHGVKCVLIAIPSANGEKIDEIVGRCSQSKVEFKILNGIGKRIEGEPRINQLRQVRLEDLLGREPVRLDLRNIEMKLRDQSVLITGAGGSIGSEYIQCGARRTSVPGKRFRNDIHR